MCTAGQRVSLTITGPGPSYIIPLKLIHEIYLRVRTAFQQYVTVEIFVFARLDLTPPRERFTFQSYLKNGKRTKERTKVILDNAEEKRLLVLHAGNDGRAAERGRRDFLIRRGLQRGVLDPVEPLPYPMPQHTPSRQSHLIPHFWPPRPPYTPSGKTYIETSQIFFM